MAKKKGKGGRTTPKGTRPLGAGKSGPWPVPDSVPVIGRGLPGFSNDEQLGLGAIAAGMLDAARRELVGLANAFDAELWASGIWGASYGKALIDADFEEVLADAYIAQAAGSVTPEGLAVLRVLAVVAPEPYATRAGRAAEELAATSTIREPRWVDGLGAWEPTGVLMSFDPVDDDGVTYFVGFRGTGPHPGPEHSLAVYIDHNLKAVKDAFSAPSLAEVEPALARAAREEGVEFAPAPVGYAAAHILWAIDAADHIVNPVVSDEFRELRALAMARCRAIVGPDPAPYVDDTPQLSPADRDALLGEFLASPECADVTAGADPDEVARLASLIDWFANDHVLGVGLRFSAVMVEIFCVDFVPRTFVGDAEDLALLGQILRGWIRFVGRCRDLPPASIEPALVAVDRWEPSLFPP